MYDFTVVYSVTYLISSYADYMYICYLACVRFVSFLTTVYGVIPFITKSISIRSLTVVLCNNKITGN